MSDPVTTYARSVVEGRTSAGRLVRLAGERHLRDRETGSERGLVWDAAAAQRILDFAPHIRLDNGRPFVPLPYQQFIVGSLFGWKSADGTRRFRTAYVEAGKGCGKTPLAALVGLYGLVADGEHSAEVYVAATQMEQANIAFRDARLMAEQSSTLAKHLDISAHNIAYPKTNSFMRRVSSEHRGLDGKRPHVVLIDELHEHPTSLVVDKMRAGTKGRKQAIIFEITNSGSDRTSVCWAHHEYSRKVLEGQDDDSWFAYVCGLDPCGKCLAAGQHQPVENCPDCDQWDDERVWEKANPGLGKVITVKYLRELVREAKGMPTKEGIVKRLNFCLWTEVATAAIPMDRWDGCARTLDRSALDGQPCFAGLDIGATSDFTALVLLFPHEDAETVEINDAAHPGGREESPRLLLRRSYTLLPFFWLPERPVRRDERMTAVIDGWRRQGLVRTTPGDVVDYDMVFDDIAQLSNRYYFQKIAVDRGFQGVHLCTKLLAHFGEQLVVGFPQGLLSMNAPFREFIELVVLGRLHHDGHPTLRWMAANCAAESRGGLTKPSKDASREKIDGITAAVMALGVGMAEPPFMAGVEA